MLCFVKVVAMVGEKVKEMFSGKKVEVASRPHQNCIDEEEMYLVCSETVSEESLVEEVTEKPKKKALGKKLEKKLKEKLTGKKLVEVPSRAHLYWENGEQLYKVSSETETKHLGEKLGDKLRWKLREMSRRKFVDVASRPQYWDNGEQVYLVCGDTGSGEMVWPRGKR